MFLQEPSPNQSIYSDILFPSPSSPELLDPSHDSSHVVDDVKCITPSPPLPSASASSPWVNGGESRMDNRCDQSAISVLATNCLEAQKLEDITPKSSYSEPHPSDRADVLVKVMNPPVPTSSLVKEVVPSVTSPPMTTIAGNSPVVRKKLFDTTPTPRLLKSPCSSSESPLSVSPDDPPSQKKLLLGSPPPNPYRVFPPNLPVNDLRHRLIQGLRASSVPVSPPDSVDHSRKTYLADHMMVLNNLKWVCYQDVESSFGGPSEITNEQCVVWRDIDNKDKQCVVLKESNDPPLSAPPQPACILPLCIDNTPSSNYSAPHDSDCPPVDTLSPTKSSDIVQHATSPTTQDKLDRAKANRLRALEILCQTFPAASTAKVAQPVPMSTASMMNHSDAGFVSTESNTRRLDKGVALPVLVAKQRNIAARDCRGASNRPLIPESISSTLNRLRTRPQSDSDEDSHFDPSPPGSPINRSDDNDLARNNVPSGQPRSDRPDSSTHGSPAPDGEDLTEDQDSDEELLFQDEDLAKLHEFRAKWSQVD